MGHKRSLLESDVKPENYFLDYQKLYAELHVMYKQMVKRVAHLEKVVNDQCEGTDELWGGQQDMEERLRKVEVENALNCRTRVRPIKNPISSRRCKIKSP